LLKNKSLRPLLLVFVGVVTILILSGCYQQWVSVGYMPADNRWRSEQRGITSIHRHSDFVIEISSSNTSRGLDSTRHEFALSLRLYLKEAGFQFEPRLVRLVAAGTEEVAPQRIEMVASAAGWESAWQCGNGPRQYKPEQMLSLGPETCFELYFPVSPPSPDASFTLRIRGLARDDKPIEIPEVHFKKGSFWVWDFLGR
jgi:hypothetical protein